MTDKPKFPKSWAEYKSPIYKPSMHIPFTAKDQALLRRVSAAVVEAEKAGLKNVILRPVVLKRLYQLACAPKGDIVGWSNLRPEFDTGYPMPPKQVRRLMRQIKIVAALKKKVQKEDGESDSEYSDRWAILLDAVLYYQLT